MKGGGSVKDGAKPPPSFSGQVVGGRIVVDEEEEDTVEAWLIRQGGSIGKVAIAYINEEAGLGLVAASQILPNDMILEVPLHACITVHTAKTSCLKEVLEKEPYLLELEDEVLALMLMAERRRGRDSPWWAYIKNIPKRYETPLWWVEDERKHLNGTNVGLLTKMMEAQVNRDWEDLYVDLLDKYPSCLGGITRADYLWALSSVWSRAVGLEAEGRYLRCLAPVLDMCNHDPQVAGSLNDLLSYDPAKQAIVFHSSRGVSQGHQCCLTYGPYSNAKLLYSYGFTMKDSPVHYRGVDYWVKVPPNARDAQWKNDQLQSHELTRQQTYDFTGTLRGDSVSDALLATIRMIQLIPEEYDQVDKVFTGQMVTRRNELATLTSLVEFLEKKISSYSTMVEEDRQALDKLQKFLDDLRRKAGAEDGGGPGVADLRASTLRRVCALRVVVEDKMVVMETLDTVRRWKERVMAAPEESVVVSTTTTTSVS